MHTEPRDPPPRARNLDGLNLTDRIYLAVHIALTGLVCVRFSSGGNWWYLAWNALVIATILFLARKRNDGPLLEFAHDWLPALLFITVFEEVSFLSLSLRGEWQNQLLVAWESALFAVPPGEWLRRHSAPWFTELLEFGYATFYLLYPVVAGVLWARRARPRFTGAFRRLTDSLGVGYVVCYTTYVIFPTRSPSNNAGLNPVTEGGPFHSLVQFIQGHAGVQGNAFPSAHIMLAFVVLVFAFRYLPRLAPWLLICVLLMCVGAVYDGYHYSVDVLAGACLGLVVGATFLNLRAPAIRA
jgi:membrane-associated phospholipid phosphatase